MGIIFIGDILKNYNKGRNEVKKLDVVSLSVEQEKYLAIIEKYEVVNPLEQNQKDGYNNHAWLGGYYFFKQHCNHQKRQNRIG